jgi:hypothetical protein
MPISLKPSEMSAGGGLWSDIDATITDVKFETSTFEGKVPGGVTVLALSVTDGAGEDHEQLLSCGKGNVPTADGKGLEDGGKFNSGSNAGIFLSSMVTGGFPENRMGEDISILVGTKAHFERVTAPKRSGIAKAPRADGKVFEDTILIVTKVLQLPWDAPKKGGKAPAQAVAKSKVAAKGKAPEADVGDEAASAIMEVLMENPEGLTKQQLTKAVFQVVKDNPNKSAIVKMCFDDEFLAGGAWSFENGVISM